MPENTSEYINLVYVISTHHIHNSYKINKKIGSAQRYPALNSMSGVLIGDCLTVVDMVGL